MVRNIIKVVLFLIAAFIAYKVWDSIAGEIRYQEEVARVEGDVIDKLEKIQKLQMLHKDEYGEFESNWDSLIHFGNYGHMKIIREYGDKDDSTSEYRREVERISIKDSLYPNYNLDSLPFVPHNEKGEKFIMNSNVITQNNVKVPVFEVKDPSPFSRERKDPDSPNPLKVGSLTEAKYSGNWK